MPKIKLQSWNFEEDKGGKIFEVEVETIQCSKTIKTMVENMGVEEEDKEDPIPLTQISAPVLEKVLEWADHHKDICGADKSKRTEKEKTTKNELSPWDDKFLTLDIDTLLDLVNAANFLDIEDLMDATTTKVSSMMLGKTVEELRDLCGESKDFTAEEEANVLKENTWLSER